MIFVDIENCGKEKYNALLRYIFSECNRIAFHFPNFLNTGNQDIKLTNKGEINPEYMEYLAKNEALIRACLHAGGTKQIAKAYNGTKLSYNTQVIKTALSFELKETLKNSHLYEWIFPDLPEDVCFFHGDICRFVTETHEQLFFISNEKKEDVSFLTEMDFDFRIKRK